MHWVGFSLGEALSRTVVHFFPTNFGSALPYPAEVKLSIFAADIERRSVVLDGARIGQPDGIRVEDAFPVLSEGAIPHYAVELSIGTNQPRVDLGPSQCLMEFNSQGLSCRYWPQLKERDSDGQPKVVPLVKDSFMSPSLIAINSTEVSQDCELFLQGLKGDASDRLPELKLAGREVREVVLISDLFNASPAQETSWGIARTRSLEVPETLPTGVLFYLLYRDSKTRRPLSVSAL